jgi:hypothetical protein
VVKDDVVVGAVVVKPGQCLRLSMKFSEAGGEMSARRLKVIKKL